MKISNFHLNEYKNLSQKFVEDNIVKNIDIIGENEVIWKVSRTKSNTTAPEVDCLYRYPEKEQVNTILSNMMNELTKIFVRVREYVRDTNGRRRQARFRVVTKQDTGFFEQIFNNMTQEYRNFYNSTTERVFRSGKDPCQHQEEIKQTWKELLEESVATLRRATLQCIQEHLRVQSRSNDKLRNTPEQLLMELDNVRSNQLDILCDKHQMCFNELL